MSSGFNHDSLVATSRENKVTKGTNASATCVLPLSSAHKEENKDTLHSTHFACLFRMADSGRRRRCKRLFCIPIPFPNHALTTKARNTLSKRMFSIWNEAHDSNLPWRLLEKTFRLSVALNKNDARCDAISKVWTVTDFKGDCCD